MSRISFHRSDDHLIHSCGKWIARVGVDGALSESQLHQRGVVRSFNTVPSFFSPLVTAKRAHQRKVASLHPRIT